MFAEAVKLAQTGRRPVYAWVAMGRVVRIDRVCAGTSGATVYLVHPDGRVERQWGL